MGHKETKTSLQYLTEKYFHIKLDKSRMHFRMFSRSQNSLWKLGCRHSIKRSSLIRCTWLFLLSRTVCFPIRNVQENLWNRTVICVWLGWCQQLNCTTNCSPTCRNPWTINASLVEFEFEWSTRMVLITHRLDWTKLRAINLGGIRNERILFMKTASFVLLVKQIDCSVSRWSAVVQMQ